MNVEQWREKGFRGSFHNLEFRFKIWSKIHSIWFYGIYQKIYVQLIQTTNMGQVENIFQFK